MVCIDQDAFVLADDVAALLTGQAGTPLKYMAPIWHRSDMEQRKGKKINVKAIVINCDQSESRK
jgi:hypothetical protein